MKQANKAGRPWQRKDGRWAARAYPPDGSKPRMVYGADEAEVIDRQHQAEATAQPETPDSQQGKPVRVTLNIPPELYRRIRKWTDAAADELGVPDVSQQDALRAMADAVTLDSSIGVIVVDLLRRAQETR